MPTSMMRWIAVSFLLVFGLVATACGDSTASTNTQFDGTPREDGSPRLSDEYFMVPAGEQVITGNVTDHVTLKVFLYRRSTGEAAANQDITFEIVEGEESLASLSAFNAQTEGQGDAAVQLRLGAEPSTVKVRATHRSANAVEFTVNALALSTGNLRIKPTNTAPSIMALGNIDIRLYRQDMISCDEFRPLFNPQPEPLMIEQAAFAGNQVTFSDLGTLSNFVVTAVARGERGQIAGAGCVDRIRVEADRTIDVEVLLQLIPLNPVGRYDVISFWDFTEALADSGAVGSIIVRVLNVFHNPGQAIYNEIIALIRNLVGGIISGTIDTFLSWTGLDTSFQNMINNFIENTEVLRRIRDAGRDLRDVVANLQIHSELTIGKLNSNYEFRGQDNWLGITLYWRWNCDANSPPDCGAIELVPDTNGQFAQLGILSAEWNGRVVAYDQLQIDRHTVSLRYGRLIRWILNEVIIAELTDGNATSMSEAFAYWIGCDRLASSILPSGEACALGACITAAQIESFCTATVSTLFTFADLLIDGLEFDMGLHLGGQGKLIELDSDGFVDRIENGLYEGFIQNADGVNSSPFEAVWSAERRDFNSGNL